VNILPFNGEIDYEKISFRIYHIVSPVCAHQFAGEIACNYAGQHDIAKR
jgi:hypothetical protein